MRAFRVFDLLFAGFVCVYVWCLYVWCFDGCVRFVCWFRVCWFYLYVVWLNGVVLAGLLFVCVCALMFGFVFSGVVCVCCVVCFMFLNWWLCVRVLLCCFYDCWCDSCVWFFVLVVEVVVCACFGILRLRLEVCSLVRGLCLVLCLGALFAWCLL